MVIKLKNLLIGINAKYIHTNLAIRLLKKNTTYLCSIIEFNIKDAKEKIINYIKEGKYDTVGFSCYIWNITLVKEVVKEIRNLPCKIILGGPEVSYNASYYLDNNLADYVIKNEGEESYHYLLEYLDNKRTIESVPNLYHKNGFTFDKLVDLDKIKMAYDLIDDYQSRIIYVETSRGCPYKCSYCMASLDNKVRFFNIEEIKKQILFLINKGTKTFKFLDRTFNANKRNFLSLIDFIIENHKEGNSFQFEITGDLLDPDVIQYINDKAPKNLFRFEIGIQSTNIEANRLVGRIQNNEKLFSNIRLIQDGQKIDLHLDLIAGLPKEDYKSFEKTFNDVLSLRPKELQLGFLKLLYGTKLKDDAEKFNYRYSQDPPYEIISNDSLSIEDIQKIHIVEDAFETYYNSSYMKKAINFILDNIDNPYQFFYNFGLHRKKEKGLDKVFFELASYLQDINFEKYDEAHILLLADYFNYFNQKPKFWWHCDKEKRTSLLRNVHNMNIGYNLDQLYRYASIVEYKSTYILAIYLPNKKEVLILNK